MSQNRNGGHCARTYAEPSVLERLSGNVQTCLFWKIVTAHVVECRHDERSLSRYDFELARCLHRSSISQDGVRDVLA